MKRGSSGEAQLRINASAARLYAMVADITRMGRWSPECVDGQWLHGATEAAVGARFRGRNRRGMARWSTTPHVVTADPGREFAFVTTHRGHDMTRWAYQFLPDGEATIVTESFEMLTDLPWYLGLTDRLLMGVRDRRADMEANLATTMTRVRAAAEAQP